MRYILKNTHFAAYQWREFDDRHRLVVRPSSSKNVVFCLTFKLN